MTQGIREWMVAALVLAGSGVANAQSWQGTGEMPLDYHAYIRDFNSGDDRGLVEKYFTTDTQMISGSGVRNGHKGLNEFLAAAHDGVREIIRPQVVMWDKDHIFAEIDMDFIASKARPDFTFGALQPGDILTVKFFAQYTVVNGKIKTLKTMTWKPETGVTKAPKLGDQAGQRAAFIAYTRAFSAGLADKYSSFYTDDVKLHLSSVGDLEWQEGHRRLLHEDVPHGARGPGDQPDRVRRQRHRRRLRECVHRGGGRTGFRGGAAEEGRVHPRAGVCVLHVA